MKHLKTFELWNYAHKDIAHSKVLTDLNDVTGIFDEESNYPTTKQLEEDWKQNGT